MIYYSTQRPISPGTYPKPQDNSILKIVNFDEKTYISEIDRAAWGWIEYAKPLDEKQATNYELTKNEQWFMEDMSNIDGETVTITYNDDETKAIVKFDSGKEYEIKGNEKHTAYAIAFNRLYKMGYRM